MSPLAGRTIKSSRITCQAGSLSLPMFSTVSRNLLPVAADAEHCGQRDRSGLSVNAHPQHRPVQDEAGRAVAGGVTPAPGLQDGPTIRRVRLKTPLPTAQHQTRSARPDCARPMSLSASWAPAIGAPTLRIRRAWRHSQLAAGLGAGRSPPAGRSPISRRHRRPRRCPEERTSPATISASGLRSAPTRNSPAMPRLRSRSPASIGSNQPSIRGGWSLNACRSSSGYLGIGFRGPDLSTDYV